MHPVGIGHNVVPDPVLICHANASCGLWAIKRPVVPKGDKNSNCSRWWNVVGFTMINYERDDNDSDYLFL